MSQNPDAKIVVDKTVPLEKMTDTFECWKCKKILPRFMFHKSASNKNREVYGFCKPCEKTFPYAIENNKYGPIKKKNRCIDCKSKYRKRLKNKLCFGCNKKMGLKQCTECKEILLIDIYFLSRNHRGGGRSHVPLGKCDNCIMKKLGRVINLKGPKQPLTDSTTLNQEE